MPSSSVLTAIRGPSLRKNFRALPGPSPHQGAIKRGRPLLWGGPKNSVRLMVEDLGHAHSIHRSSFWWKSDKSSRIRSSTREWNEDKSLHLRNFWGMSIPTVMKFVLHPPAPDSLQGYIWYSAATSCCRTRCVNMYCQFLIIGWAKWNRPIFSIGDILKSSNEEGLFWRQNTRRSADISQDTTSESGDICRKPIRIPLKR